MKAALFVRESGLIRSKYSLKDTSLTNEGKNTIYTRAAIVTENPKAQIKKEFNGKTYIFKYDNDFGYLIVEFTMDYRE